MRKDNGIRKKYKDCFILKHLRLSHEAFVMEDVQSLNKLVKLAREELHYSTKTVACDIRRSLRETFKKVDIQKGEDDGKVKET